MPEKLAINGGTPVRTKSWQEPNSIGKEEEAAVARVMKSKQLSLFMGVYDPQPPYSFFGGPEVQALEETAKKMFGAKYVVSVNSATSGLFAAIGALGIGYGDEVIVSPYTMSACAVAPLVYGAIPVFADVDQNGSLDPVSIRERITPRTKAILVVHQFGIPAQMNEIMKIAKEHNLKIIEDCAQAWGAKFDGKYVGTIGDIGVMSFNVHKTIQSGEGGLCFTNDDEVALRLQMIRNHGESIVESAKYENIENIVGFNYRMTELQAAVAHEQLKKLEELNAGRKAMVKKFYEGVAKHDCFVLPDLSKRDATYYVCPFRYLSAKCGNTPRADLVKTLKAEGIPFAEAYVKPLYLLPIFQKKTAFKNGYPWSAPENKNSNPSYSAGTAPNAEKLHTDELLMQIYLCHPQTMVDVDDMITAIDKVVLSFKS